MKPKRKDAIELERRILAALTTYWQGAAEITKAIGKGVPYKCKVQYRLNLMAAEGLIWADRIKIPGGDMNVYRNNPGRPQEA